MCDALIQDPQINDFHLRQVATPARPSSNGFPMTRLTTKFAHEQRCQPQETPLRAK